MAKYLVVGNGPIGSGVTRLLLDQGHEVLLATRRGAGSLEAGLTLLAADASDAEAMSSASTGCAAIFNCANPAYHRWPTDWPPIAAALLRAAESSGAVLVTMSNLYVYGAVDGPMSVETPLAATYEKAVVRATMWRNALLAHQQGRARVSEVRASDFIGPRGRNVLGEQIITRLLAGKRCWILGDADQPHSWTYTNDAARTLVACAQESAAWGRAWHAPTNLALSQRSAIEELCDVAGVARVKVSKIPALALRLVGLANPVVRELPQTSYQFKRPFVIDDAATRRELGLEPTPWSDVLAATIAGFA